MDQKVFDAVKQSYGRTLANADLMKDFYEAFTGSHPDIVKMFAQTDLKKQRETLKASLSMAILFPQDNLVANSAMKRVRDSHSRSKLNINPELYIHWLNALVGVVSNSDPEFTPLLEQQWREVLGHTVSYIQEGY